jgi:Phage integrase family
MKFAKIRTHRITPRRTHRTPLGERGFRAADSPRPQVGSCDGRGNTENGGVEERSAVGRANCRVAFRVARQTCAYPASGDWVFASPAMKGKQPYWPGTQWRYYGKPALKRTRITKHLNYHTFRHTFGTLLNASGENPKVVQELLRHASPESDHRRLHAGGQSTEARSTEQTGEDGLEKGRFKITGPNWTMKKSGGVAEVLYFVGVPVRTNLNHILTACAFAHEACQYGYNGV